MKYLQVEVKASTDLLGSQGKQSLTTLEGGVNNPIHIVSKEELFLSLNENSIS
jgi:hypothetical protein